MENYGFNHKRKRNTGMFGVNPEAEQSYGLNWNTGQAQHFSQSDPDFPPMNEDLSVEVSDDPLQVNKQSQLISGKVLRSKYQQLRPNLSANHQKITLYLPREIINVLVQLKKARMISSYSDVTAEALVSFLTEPSEEE